MVGWTFTEVAGQSLEHMDFDCTSALLKEEVTKLQSLLNHDHTDWAKLDATDHSTWITFAVNRAREEMLEKKRAERKAEMTKTAEASAQKATQSAKVVAAPSSGASRHIISL